MVVLILAGLGIILNLLIGIFVYTQEKRSKLNQAVFWLAFSLCFWQLTNYLADQTSSHTLFWNRATFIGPMFAFYFAGLFVYNLSKLKPLTSTQKVMFVLCAAFSIFAMTGWVIAEIVPRQMDGLVVGYDVVRSRGYYLLIAWIVYLLIDFLFNLRDTYKKAAGKLKQQLNTIVLGISSALFMGVSTNLLIPLFTGSTEAAKLAPLTGIFIMSTFAFAIVRHGLFDIKFFVVRAAAYSLTILTLSFLYVGPVLYIMIKALGFEFILPKFIVALLVASLAAFFYQNVRHRFDRTTAKIFFRDQYDPELFIAQLNKAVVSNLDLKSMLSSAAEVISQNIKADYCLFVVEDMSDTKIRTFGTLKKVEHFHDLEFINRQVSLSASKIIVTEYMEENSRLKAALRKNDIAVIGQMTGDIADSKSTLSYIVLGPKKGGNVYNNQDVRILGTIVDGLIVAIQNAIRFEEIQNFNVTLQQKVDDATRQLRRTNAKLEALDETKDDFISMASHQLRTPLTSVKGYVSMVLEGDAGKLTALQRKMLDQAFMSSQRMVFLIADLLNVSRLKTGKFVIEPIKLNLVKLIQDEIDQLKQTAAAHSLTLIYDKPADTFPEVMLDETKTRQVVMNFIDNAIFYTPAGGHITVKLSETASAIELRVTDDGIGVPKREQPHLFTKFYRAGNARRARPDGTGLGLFMAKKVIIAQGGAVLFESKEGKGSTFGFIISKQKVLPEASPKTPALPAAHVLAAAKK